VGPAVSAATDSLAIVGERRFTIVGDGEQFLLRLLDVPIDFMLDRAHRERGELVGELTVRTDLVGARTFDGALSRGKFNCSSASARQTHAKILTELSRAPQIDWHRLLEEFCIRVLNADGTGRPGVRLCEVPEPQKEQEFELIDGMPVPMRHSSILFADGGSLKSLILLYGLGLLARQGVPCALFDWELDESDHRARYVRLFEEMPRDLHYLRCDRPLVYEADRIRRFTRERGILFAGLDSIGFGTDGPPEAAEHALAYNRTLRSFGIGTFLTAHVTKNGDQADQRPFGSGYWHNSARSTWFGKVGATSPDGRTVSVGLFNPKEQPRSTPTGHRARGGVHRTPDDPATREPSQLGRPRSEGTRVAANGLRPQGWPDDDRCARGGTGFQARHREESGRTQYTHLHVDRRRGRRTSRGAPHEESRMRLGHVSQDRPDRRPWDKGTDNPVSLETGCPSPVPDCARLLSGLR
jgi:hypothetical protein